jgi:hypothetical protein
VDTNSSELKPSFLQEYGLNPQKNYSIFTTSDNEDDDLVSMSIIGKMEKKGKTQFVYKIFSKSALSDKTLKVHSKYVVSHWLELFQQRYES